MDLKRTVEAARSGDREAFTALIAHFGDMAFRYAAAILGDYHLAEDATQEAFVAAYFSLARLKEPESFAAWLRGIVRNQCLRTMRGRRLAQVPLDDALHLPVVGVGPEEQAELHERRGTVAAAIMALPEAQREVVTLYYAGEYSQREVAAFLDVPVTTVNNRLHAARQQLKGGLTAMAEDDLKKHALPDDFPERVGKIVDVRGPVVDAQFDAQDAPEPLDAITLDERITLTVAQKLADGRVRCVHIADEGLVRAGMRAVDRGTIAVDGITAHTIRETVSVLIGTRGAPGGVLETGIKTIDLLCPIPAGGVLALYGPAGAGKMVVLAELLARLADGVAPLSIVNFTEAGHRVDVVEGDGPPAGSGLIDAIYLPVSDAGDPSSPAVGAARDLLQAGCYMSRAMAEEGLYPSIDPLLCWSSVLAEETVGAEHVRIANLVKKSIARFLELRHTPDSDLSPEDRNVLATGERLRLYLTQPFFVGERFTGIPGQHVPMVTTLRDCAAILSGRHNDISAVAFRFSGTLDRVLAKAAG